MIILIVKVVCTWNMSCEITTLRLTDRLNMLHIINTWLTGWVICFYVSLSFLFFFKLLVNLLQSKPVLVEKSALLVSSCNINRLTFKSFLIWFIRRLR